uniref:interferon regulatory factor 3 isoform X2 n=1 Tax=Doryrhamphus excisus TaxID=161450 RepID=UPI0025AE41D5|nr:interferon regulatory factor 3 isoform X2 [Doryrhamphus excisus]
MAHSKPLLIQWLRTQIDSGTYPGVHWTNQQETEFCIPWKHALRQDASDTDILIFKAWAKVSGNGRIQGDASVWKRNFRSALRAKKFKMIADNKNDTANPHKVFRWPDSTSVDSAGLLSQHEPDLYESPPLNEIHVVPFLENLYCAEESNPKEDILQRCLQEMNIGPETETQFRISVYYRGEKVSEQLVDNEAGFRLVYRPQMTEPMMDKESGLSLVSLPSPTTIRDQTQAKLTQCILDKLGEGLDLGVSGDIIYGQRRGEIKAFWSFSQFDQSGQKQEISKLQRQPLYQFKDFIQGILDFIGGKSCGPCSLFLCLGEKWPDPDNRPWNKKLIMVEVVITSLEILKNLAVEGGASSLQSVELQLSLEEMVIG